MNLKEIKEAVEMGKKVYWSNENYQVIKDKYGYLIMCLSNQNCTGLTHRDGITINGAEHEFYINDN